MSVSIKQNVKPYVYEWNIRFPIDRWWRKKHGVPYCSKEHLDSSFIDMVFEYLEDRIYQEASKDDVKKYEAGTGNWIERRSGMTEEQVDDAFDRIKI